MVPVLLTTVCPADPTFIAVTDGGEPVGPLNESTDIVLSTVAVEAGIFVRVVSAADVEANVERADVVGVIVDDKVGLVAVAVGATIGEGVPILEEQNESKDNV